MESRADNPDASLHDDKPPSGPITLPTLMIGGAVFSFHYNADVDAVPTEAILSRAISSGANELVMGSVLSKLRSKQPRNSYKLITKCGRLAFDDFDYSPSWVRKSVMRSLQRLQTSYLDVVFLHDAEFVSTSEAIAGAGALLALQREGVIRSFGLSGYTLSVLLDHAKAIKDELGVAPECLFSYCHYNLQNTLLEEFAPRFREVGTTVVINGSPLSMGLLRAEGPPDWHPAGGDLKQAGREANRLCEAKGVRLADMALKFSLGFEGTTCVGCSSMEELETAIAAWKVAETVKENRLENREDNTIFTELKGVFEKDRIETVWQAPPRGWTRKAGK